MEETWDPIGAKLRQSREKAGLAVDDVVFRARIPKTVVEALEAEDFSVFSSPTYAKSFLRQYSEFLGVDAEPWLDALEPAAYVGGDVALEPVLGTGAPASSQAKRTPREHGRHEEAPVRDNSGKWAAVWLMLLTAALVFAIVKGYNAFDQKFGGDEEPAKRVATPETKDSKPQQAPDQSSQPAVSQESQQVSDSPTDEESAPAPREEARPPRAIIVRD